MPCRDDREYEDIADLGRLVNQLTNMLCIMCKDHEPSTTEIREWWKNHQDMDRKRQQTEAVIKERERQQRHRAYLKLKKEFG